jgi:hypothetical protein
MLLVIAYVKKVLKALESKGDAEAIAEFKANAAAAIKKISANYDNYDVLMGQSTDGDAMYVPFYSTIYALSQTNCLSQAHPD